MTKARMATLLLLATATIAALVWAFWPAPVPVDMAEARLAPLRVTVSAEGVTRVRTPYLVTAPISGTAIRSPVEIGDPVTQDETVVAAIRPAEPALLDARARAEAEAAVVEAEAGFRLAEANLARARSELDFAESQLERNRQLAARGTIPQRVLEDSQQQVQTAQASLEAAKSERAMREAMLRRAEAVLVGPAARIAEFVPGACCTEITAPQSGTVLSVEEMSARQVQVGEPLLTIGDLSDLEVEVDLLSADAVRLRPGAPATIERWGGEEDLEARVRRIDPAGFTRISALGIEEQRVRVLFDFVSPPEKRAGLGNAFRVFVRVVIWEDDEVLQIPVSALFRVGDDWAVYRVADGLAERRIVEIGRRTAMVAQVLDGLSAGDIVVNFPGDRVTEGVAIVPRDED